MPSSLSRKEPPVLARRRGRTPMLNAATDEVARGELAATLYEICREGDRWMLAAALEAEGRHTLPVWLGRSVSTVTVWQSATVITSRGLPPRCQAGSRR